MWLWLLVCCACHKFSYVAQKFLEGLARLAKALLCELLGKCGLVSSKAHKHLSIRLQSFAQMLFALL